MSVKRLFFQLSQSCRSLTKWNQVTHSQRMRHISAFKKHVVPAGLLKKRMKLSDDIDAEIEALFRRTDPNNVTPDDWRTAHLSYENVQTVRTCLKVLGSKELYTAGKSFVDMLQKHEPQYITPFTEMSILRFLVECKNKCSESDTEYIVNTCRKIMQKCETLDSYSSETLILALLMTPKWRDAIDLLGNLKLFYKVSAKVYSTIIIKAMKDNDVTLAWRLLDDMMAAYCYPSDECWFEWLRLCGRMGLKWEDGVGRMIDNYYTHHIHMSTAVAKDMTSFINDHCPEYSVSETTVTTDGKCSSCPSVLRTEFSEADHIALKEFVEKIFYKNHSLFASTTPREMLRFQNAVASFKAYDYVVDGLNVLYSTKVDARLFIQKLKRDYNAQIFFLARTHLTKKSVFSWIKENVSCVFLCDDDSLDDAFLLYAAVFHRADVKFVSCDKFRAQFALLLSDSRRNLFLRWQHMNQINMEHIKPRLFLPEIHKSENGSYHIPCVQETSEDLTWKAADPEYWLCVTRKQLGDTEREKTQTRHSAPVLGSQKSTQANDSEQTSTLNSQDCDDDRKALSALINQFQRIHQKREQQRKYARPARAPNYKKKDDL